MTERINISKKFINKTPEQYLEKLKFFYMVHGKSISEFSPDLNILLRKFVIKKIYDLSQLNSTIKQKCEDLLKSICGIEKAKNISSNFDPEKICKYEDYISFIEKSFQQAEEDFNENILENNFDNYLQLISVYRLICDISDLIDCWKEKDEKIEKFQRLCKYRCIQIMTAKKEYENGPLFEIDKEIKQMEKELIMNQSLNKEINKKENEDNKNNNLKKNNTISHINNLEDKKIQNLNLNENSSPKNNYVTNFIDIKENNPYLNLSLNFKEVYEKKKNEIKDNNINEDNEIVDPGSFQLVDNPYNSILSENNVIVKKSSILPPKKKIVKTIDNEQVEIEKMLNDLKGNKETKKNIKDINQNNKDSNQNKNQDINKNNKDSNQNNNKDSNQNKKDLNQNKNKDSNQNNNKDSKQNKKDSNQNKNKNTNQNNKNLNQNNNKDSNQNNNKDSNQNNNKDINQNNKDLNQNKNKDINQNNKDLIQNKNKDTNQNNKDLNQNKNKDSNQNKKNKDSNQNKNKDSNKNKNKDSNKNNNKDTNQNSNLNQNNKNDDNKEKPFKQLKSNLLKDYKYPGNKKLDINIPVIYRDVDYIYLLDYLKKTLIRDTISTIEKNDVKNALSQSEMLLYYLTNIKPKDSDIKNSKDQTKKK